MRYKLLFTFCLALACLAGPAHPAFGAPAKGKTIVFGRSADAVFLDPAKFLDNESAMVIENIFDGLVRYSDDTTRIEPALATSWTITGEGRVFTFQMRRGVRFHDGTPVNAQAAQFSLLRKIDPSHPFYRPAFGKMDTTLKSVKSVEALDDTTLRITLKEPYAPFLDELARHSAYIVSPTAVRQLGDEFEKRPVGTGPFIFESWLPGDRIILKANPDYFGGAPRIAGVIFKVIPDGKVRLLALKSGAIQAMDGLAPEDRDEVRRTPDLALDAKPGMNVGYLAMNTERAPFDNPKVRRAVALAINRDALVKLFYRGMASPAASLVPPTMWSHSSAIAPTPYDPKQARKLLRQAGLAAGFETTLWAMPVTRPYMPQPEKIARFIQENLAAVGIRARIVSHEWPTYLAKVYAGEHDLCLLGWVSTGEPSDLLGHLLDSDNAVKPHASNISFFRDKRVHELLAKAQASADPAERSRLYGEVQRIASEEMPLFPLAHGHQALAHARQVQGIVNHQTGVVRFAKAWVQ